MITYKWSILETFGDTTITKVRYVLKAQDEVDTAETEGEHTFNEGTITKVLESIKEQDLIDGVLKDITQDHVNLIKLNLENQLKALKTSKKMAFPWENDTFTIG